jgi:hypothetical protein
LDGCQTEAVLRVISAVLAILLGGIHFLNGLTSLISPPSGGDPAQKPASRGSIRDPAMSKIPPFARAAFALGGLVVLGAGVLLFLQAGAWLWVYLAGWAIVQAVAIYNGLTAYGNLKWSHHVVRFLIFGMVFGLAFWSMR